MTLTETPPEQARRRPRPWLEPLIRTGAVVVSLLAVVVTAVVELYLTQLYIGGVQTGASVLFTVVATWGICRFVLFTTGRRWTLAPPWALWTLVMLFSAGLRKNEGDYLLSGNNWTAMVSILVGSLIFAVCAYRAILRPNIGTTHRPKAELRGAELRDDPPYADR